ncbi:MAG: Ig-like domain-containing protein [bacterium]|nr:Ig-like domain-containing protein [bacterium]
MSVDFDSTRSIDGDLVLDETNPSDIVCTFTPSDPLNDGDTISCTVAAGLADSRGNPMVDDFVWTFSTQGTSVTETTWGAIKAVEF